MNTCLDCIHHNPPAILDAGHPCIRCDGNRVVLNGSNFKAKEPAPRPTWTEYFLQIAALAATRSKDRSTKVGAVIVDNSRAVVSTGYNGFPAGIDDEIEERHERPTKYLYTCHAEENAILSAARRGVSVNNCTLYCTHQPCSRCARGIVQAGIRKVVFPYDTIIPTMADDVKVGLEILNEADVEAVFHGMEEHCADPAPYENTKSHDVTEVHEGDQ